MKSGSKTNEAAYMELTGTLSDLMSVKKNYMAHFFATEIIKSTVCTVSELVPLWLKIGYQHKNELANEF